MAINPLIGLHQAFNAREEDTFRSMLAADVVWHTPGNHPMAGTLTGRDEMWAQYAARAWESPARIEDHAELSHPDHSQVAVLFTVVNDFGDGPVRLPGLEVARVRDGQIAERWEFEEDQALVDRLITRAAERRASGPG